MKNSKGFTISEKDSRNPGLEYVRNQSMRLAYIPKGIEKYLHFHEDSIKVDIKVK